MTSSARSDDGKNCCCTNCMPNERASERRHGNADSYPPVMHAHRARRERTPGNSSLVAVMTFQLGRQDVTPSSGVNSTATIHDTINETAITTNKVKVNSPALLLLRPIGINPATVTSVPVSIGKAVDVKT